MKNIDQPTHFINKLKNACSGIGYSVKTEKHLRFHFFVSLVVIGCGIYFMLTKLEWLFIVFAISTVVIAELFNTAIERVVDLVKPGYHPIAGMAKDIASGAVLVAAIQAVVIGLAIFVPYIF